MLLITLALTHIRNYTTRTFSFSPHSTYIVGPNTSGKTNILEAIFAITTGKSFRADQDREMIQWGSEIGRIKATMGDTTCEIVVTNGIVNGATVPLKKYTVNGVPRRMIDFVGNLRAVLFWPEHMELVTDSPSLRRRYLDSVLVQVDREYRRNLLSYERGLRQRNRLLDLINVGKAGRSQLFFWNQLLTKAGGYLTDKRAECIDYINGSRLAIHNYQLAYDKSVISEARLAQYAEEEVAAKATLVGPHRDDFQFFMAPSLHKHHHDMKKGELHDLLNVGTYGSRGEQRLAVLWLKLAEVAFIHEKTGERPMLLLDDILSELDREHRELVLDLIGKQQTVITSADEEIFTILPKKKETPTELISLSLA